MLDDPLNTIESEIVNLIQGDGGYSTNTLTGDGGEVDPDNVHEKFRDNLRNYMDHELPAVAVTATGYDEGNTGEYKDNIHVLVQAVTMGADLETMDGTIKTIIGKLIALFKAQSPHYRGKTCLLGNADDIYGISAQMIYGTLEQGDKIGPIVVLGQVALSVMIICK